jgi:hypothetical protein
VFSFTKILLLEIYSIHQSTLKQVSKNTQTERYEGNWGTLVGCELDSLESFEIEKSSRREVNSTSSRLGLFATNSDLTSNSPFPLIFLFVWIVSLSPSLINWDLMDWTDETGVGGGSVSDGNLCCCCNGTRDGIDDPTVDMGGNAVEAVGTADKAWVKVK